MGASHISYDPQIRTVLSSGCEKPLQQVFYFFFGNNFSVSATSLTNTLGLALSHKPPGLKGATCKH